jgi:short-subunit dehydrogenase
MSRRIILITGASGGIGSALARAYARPGVLLLLWGRDATRLEQTATACRTRGAECQIERFDLRDTDGLAARLNATDAMAPIDIAIFNAGLGGTAPEGSAAETAEGSRAVAEVNFVAPVIGANVMAAAMAKRGRGQIVLIGSIAESFPLPMAPTYAATKAGLRMFAEALGIRLSSHGVSVTLVSPGFIDTAMSRQVTEPKPFLMSADKAAAIIMRGIERKARAVVLPWQFRLIRGLTGLLPRAVLRGFLSRT